MTFLGLFCPRRSDGYGELSFQPTRGQLAALLSTSRLLTSSIDIHSLLQLIVTWSRKYWTARQVVCFSWT
jgi:hypothetical protein